MSTVRHFAAYYIPENWVFVERPSREAALAQIAEWRTKWKFDYPMKIITETKTVEEEEIV